LSEPVFWAVLGLMILPSCGLLMHLDRTADHPQRLRGHSHA
jgi:hypothetical protein